MRCFLQAVFAVMVLGNSVVVAEEIPALHGPYQPGTLAVAVSNENESVIFKIVMASEDLLDFSGTPTTKAQRDKVFNQYTRLYAEESLPKLFRFAPKEACLPEASSMQSQMLTYVAQQEDENKDSIPEEALLKKVGDAKGHSDFELIYVFNCQNLEGLMISFSEVFPKIKKVAFYLGEIKGAPVHVVKASDAIIHSQDLQ